MNRGIIDKAKILAANDVVLENLKQDLQAKGAGEPIYHIICFLLAYLDVHQSFGYLNERKAQDVMHYLSDHYEINVPL